MGTRTLSVFETSSQTAYYFKCAYTRSRKLHRGRSLGSGKTVFLSLSSGSGAADCPAPKAPLRRSQDRGAEIFIRAMGGQYEVLSPGEPTGFNPLALPDNGENREFLFQLFAYMLKPAMIG